MSTQFHIFTTDLNLPLSFGDGGRLHFLWPDSHSPVAMKENPLPEENLFNKLFHTGRQDHEFH